MKTFQTFQVFPDIPEPLSFLETLSRNLWWSWQVDAMELFRRIDHRLWNDSEHNPILFLTLVPQKRLEELASDEGFLVDQQRVKERFEENVSLPVDHPGYPFGNQGAIAYFSMEFGIHQSIPFFAGGLGILAGDHLKAASNMALPLTGIGLFYRYGYFRQFLNQDGIQQEDYPEIIIYNLPIERATDISGNDLRIKIDGPDGDINAIVWKINVGRIPLYLLDANIPENPKKIRDITSRLYPGDQKLRLCQEILLGIGGIRALTAMGVTPAVCHMNEGHAAFASIERSLQTISRYKVDLQTALEIVPRTTVFTTHTPVAAGYDEYPADLVTPFLHPLEEQIGCRKDEFLSWGQAEGTGHDEPLSMFVLGLRTAQFCNGVSELHGKIARRMWSHVWPKRPKEEVPISHITNGIHIPTWISEDISILFDRYLGPEWNTHSWNPEILERLDDIFDEELWSIHEISRSRLINTCRKLMVKQYGLRNAPNPVMKDAETVLDQDALTIVFARRFTTYKRSYLLLMDEERLEAIINSKTRPVQFIFAGKAHPRDNEAKDLIKRLIDFSHRKNMRHRMIFLEDYSINMAKALVKGADVWLNTPRRPFEACGTSGMKAAINGVLNLSILDGWWCEGYNGKNGWKIGNGENYIDHAYQDSVESHALYNILENEVITCFYDRKDRGMPVRWIKMMKESMKTILKNFSSCRMVTEYERRFYLPIANKIPSLLENNAANAKKMQTRKNRLHELWGGISIKSPVREKTGFFRTGENVHVNADVSLGKLLPDEVEVQLYYGHMKSGDKLVSGITKLMSVEKNKGEGRYVYTCAISCKEVGRYGFTARIIPGGDSWIKNTPGLITWA